MISKKTNLDKLGRLYQQASDSNTPEGFRVAYYRYMEVYDTDQSLETFGKLIEDHQVQKLITFNELDKQTRKEIQKTREAISDFIIVHNITNPVLEQELESLSYAESIPIESGIFSALDLYTMLRQIIFIFPITRCFELEFLEQYINISREGVITKCTLIPSLKDWEKEYNKIWKTKKTQIGFAWNESVKFYESHDTEKLCTEKEMDILKQYLHIVHNFYTENLFNEATLPNILTYNKFNGLLQIDGKTIQFNTTTAQAKLLACFFLNGSPLKKRISHEALHEIVFKSACDNDSFLEKDENDQIHGVRREINKKVRNKLNTTKKFFLSKNSENMINPEFLS